MTTDKPKTYQRFEVLESENDLWVEAGEFERVKADHKAEIERLREIEADAKIRLDDRAQRMRILENRCHQEADLRERAEAEVERLRQALHDIAHGNPPKGEMPSLDDPNAFRHGMWTWSQKHARRALGEE